MSANVILEQKKQRKKGDQEAVVELCTTYPLPLNISV